MVVRTVFTDSYTYNPRSKRVDRTYTVRGKQADDYATKLNSWLRKLTGTQLAALADAAATDLGVSKSDTVTGEGIASLPSSLARLMGSSVGAIGGFGHGGDFGGGGASGSYAGGSNPDATGPGGTPGFAGGDLGPQQRGAGGIGKWWTEDRQQEAMRILMTEGGLPEVSARAMVARWAAVEAPRGPGSVGGYMGHMVGQAQWSPDRVRKLGGLPGDMPGQTRAAIRELKSTEGYAYSLLKGARNEREAAIAVAEFERASGHVRGRGDAFVDATVKAMGQMKKGGGGKDTSTVPNASENKNKTPTKEAPPASTTTKTDKAKETVNADASKQTTKATDKATSGTSGAATTSTPSAAPSGGGTVSIRRGVNMEGVNAQMVDLVNRVAAMEPKGTRVEIISARRPADYDSQHRWGRVLDISIYEPGKKYPLANIRRPPGSHEYEVYERFAARMRAMAKQLYGKETTWGGHFRQGVPLDLMHMQAGGAHFYDFSAGTKAKAEAEVAAWLKGPGAGQPIVTAGGENWLAPGAQGGGPPPNWAYGTGSSEGGGYAGGGPGGGYGYGGRMPQQWLETFGRPSAQAPGGYAYPDTGGAAGGVPQRVELYIKNMHPKYQDAARRYYMALLARLRGRG